MIPSANKRTMAEHPGHVVTCRDKALPPVVKDRGVNMAFKISSSTVSTVKDPETLFRDLRSRSVEGLMAQQADMLRSYMSNVDEADLALELPTGSGKTLVGLLIAEWRRRTRKERCVFLCPTRQLVHQVVEQADDKYGISVLGFAGSHKACPESDKARFLNCEAIGVATYSALFNTKPFFDDVGTIVFDDAHAAENYVSNFWTLEVKRRDSRTLFNAIWGLIVNHVPKNDQLRHKGDEDGPIDGAFVNKLPTPALLEVKAHLIGLLDASCTEGEHLFRWQMIRDHLHACHLYYTDHSIVIRPLIAPTQSFLPFSIAKQRIYMSATLGEGGDLERIFGRPSITRIPAPPGWDKQGIGRRFFVFPMRVWDEKEAEARSLGWISRTHRCLVLTPRDAEAKRIKELLGTTLCREGYRLFDASEIEASKKVFTETDKAIAVLANRYDGIDFIGDECRYLILHGLPESTNLQERFLVSRLGSAVLFNARIRTRVTQAAGRCTRSATDYALVVVVGEKVNTYLLKPENRRQLHPELQAEVEFGIKQSDVDAGEELSKNIDSFFAQNGDWKVADEHILETRDGLSQAAMPAADALAKTVANEVKYQNSMWNEHYEEALARANDVLAELGGDQLRGYRALWAYLAGNAAHLLSVDNISFANVARTHYAGAAGAANTLPWLKQLGRLSPSAKIGRPTNGPSPSIGDSVEVFEAELASFGKSNSGRLEKHFAEIRSGLGAYGSKAFEEAQVKVGRLLGCFADNSDEQGAPDPWWVFGDAGIVFEDYTDTGANPVISKAKTLQASGHPNWLRGRFPHVSFSVVVCSRSSQLHTAATPHTGGLFYIEADKFLAFSEKVMMVVRSLWDTYPGEGDMIWRAEAVAEFDKNGLSRGKIVEYFTATKLASLPTAD